jgi:hypothetical protein
VIEASMLEALNAVKIMQSEVGPISPCAVISSEPYMQAQ